MSRKLILALYGTTDFNTIMLRTCIGFLCGAAAAILQRWLMDRGDK